MDDFSCAVYVYVSLELDELRVRIAELLGGNLRRATIRYDQFLVDVHRNMDADSAEADAGRGPFVRFPFLLDVEAADGYVEADTALAGFSKVIAALEELDAVYVTASEFEDQLPHFGRNREL